jgi:membrane-associated phospholipid phosphatase
MPTSQLKFRLSALALCAAGLAAPVAAQQRPAPQTVRFSVSAWPDAAVLGALAATASIPAIFQDELPHATCAPCDPSGLLGIDRGTVGIVDTTWHQVSNVTLLVTVAASGALLYRARGGEPDRFDAAVEDAVILAQSVLAASAATNWLKVAFARPRPPRYTDQAGLYEDADYGVSLPSGHASTAFAAAATYWSIQQRRGQAGRRTAEIVGLFALAAVTGGLRVAAHKHFPTDVLAGAALGTAIGWTVPRLHGLRLSPM